MKSNKTINSDYSEKVACAVNAQDGECLANVLRAFLDELIILPADAYLVQGVQYKGGQPIIHCWIETDDEIIDPTLIFQINDLIQTIKYYPIQCLTPENVEKEYHNKNRGKNLILQIPFGYDDLRVEKILQVIDTPPMLKRVVPPFNKNKDLGNYHDCRSVR